MKRKHLGVFALAASMLCGLAITSCGNDNNQTQTGPVSLSGEGAPLASMGKNGDTYRDTLTDEVYDKIDGKWVKRETITEGSGVPSPAFGKDGDKFKDITTGDIYEKQDGKWVIIEEGNLIAKHTVTIDLAGGNINGEIAVGPIMVRHNSPLTPLPNPVKDKCKFLGWVTENNGQQFAYNFDLPVVKDLTLIATYAVDEAAKVIIMVDPNNGEAPYEKESFDGDTLRVTAPTKEGFDFAGWYFEDDGSLFSGTVRKNHNGRKIVAKWVKAQFNYKYNIELNGEATITGLRNRETTIFNCPEQVDGHKITKIADTAFQSFHRLTHISLPSGITYLNARAFIGCRALQEVNIAAANTSFVSKEGVVYTKDMKTIVFCPSKNTQGAFTIPASVTKIGHHAFYGHGAEGVTSLTLPSGLVEIEERAFYDMSGLSSITFPSTLKKIGEAAFCCLYQGNLQQIKFNEGLEFIGDMCFGGQYIKGSLILPSTLVHLGQYAFINCKSITEITIPKAMTEFMPNAFNGCTGILKSSVAAGNTAYVQVENVMYTADMKTAVFCPSGNRAPVNIPEGVTEIREAAFYMCDNTREYTLPSTLKKIGYRAFAECYELMTFAIPDSVTEVGEDLFHGCSSLSTVTIGKGLTTLPKYMFSECTSLSKIVIPQNIVSIGENCFFGCPISSVTFNEGLQTIGNGAFFYQQSFDGEIASGPAVGPITELKLPNSLISIGNNAFGGHSNLARIEIGSSLKEFNVNAFHEDKLTTITVNANNPYLKVLNGIVYSKDGKTIYFATSAVSGDISLDSTVETVGEYAFYKNKITSLIIPSSVKTIGKSAFQNNEIKVLDIPSNVTTIGEDAFYSNDYLETLTLNEGLVSIGKGAFTFAGNIQTLTLPNSLKVLGEGAFKLCSKLTTVTFGTGLESIGADAFNRANLTGVINIPASVTFIGDQAFFSDNLTKQSQITDIVVDQANTKYTSENGLLMNKEKTEVYMYACGNARTELTLPATVKKISNYALAYANKLTTLNLNEGLEYIGDYGLKGVSNVMTINIPASVTYIGKEAFGALRTKQTVQFNCTKEYAIKNFHEYYALSSQATLLYAGEGTK